MFEPDEIRGIAWYVVFAAIVSFRDPELGAALFLLVANIHVLKHAYFTEPGTIVALVLLGIAGVLTWLVPPLGFVMLVAQFIGTYLAYRDWSRRAF